MTAAWEHLLPLVSALERGGNAAIAPGFVPAEGGYECAMRDPLDFALMKPFLAMGDKDVHVAEPSDMVWCSHCWASIFGPRRIAESHDG